MSDDFEDTKDIGALDLVLIRAEVKRNAHAITDLQEQFVIVKKMALEMMLTQKEFAQRLISYSDQIKDFAERITALIEDRS